MTEKYTPKAENANLLQEFQKRALEEYGEVLNPENKCAITIDNNQVVFGDYDEDGLDPYNGIYNYNYKKSQRSSNLSKNRLEISLWVFENDAQEGFYNPKRPKNYEYRKEECLGGDCEFLIPQKLDFIPEINQEHIQKFVDYFNQLQNKPAWIEGILLSEQIFQDWLECDPSNLVVLFDDIFESAMKRSGIKEAEAIAISVGAYTPFNYIEFCIIMAKEFVKML